MKGKAMTMAAGLGVMGHPAAAPSHAELDRAELARILTACRRLDPLEQAIALGQAKALYERLHPEVTHGGNRRAPRTNTAPAFADHAARESGVSPRAIRLAARRIALLHPDAVACITGTWIARKGVYLDRLGQMPRDQQRGAAEALLAVAGDTPPARAARQRVAKPAGRRYRARITPFDRHPALAAFVRENLWQMGVDEMMAECRATLPDIALPSRSAFSRFLRNWRNADRLANPRRDFGKRRGFFDRHPDMAAHIREAAARMTIDELVEDCATFFPGRALPSRSTVGRLLLYGR